MGEGKEREEKRSSRNKKESGIAAAVWLILAIIILLLFVGFHKRIVTNLKTTGFFERTIGKTPSFIENAEVEEIPDTEQKNDVEPVAPVEIELLSSASSDNGEQEDEEAEEVSPQNVVAKNDAARAQQNNSMQNNEKKQTETVAQPQSADKKAVESKKSEAKASSPAQSTKTVPAEQKVPVMNLKLCFMTIGSDGSVTAREVTRTMKKSDSPLADSVNALIQGPNSSEEDSGCRTLISNGTRLLGASVKNGVATLNFSGEFEFNQYGIEGTRGQLEQIVYTATAFPTVDSVQFLVDGEKKDYLGLEGVWIGSPLTRNSF